MINILRVTMVVFFLILNPCFAQKKLKNDIEFKILDKVARDNSCVSLLIKNNSSYDYYLPIINSFESERWKFMLPKDESSFFFIYMTVYNVDDKIIKWHSDNCYSEHFRDENLSMFNDQWVQKRKNIRVEDLILLKAGERKKFKVPVHLKVKLSDDCFWEIENYKEEELKFTYYYRKKQSEMIYSFLDEKIIKKLEQLKYKLYDKEVESNKVRLRVH